ncbi:hypothetical protein M1307_02825, partial [Patescibacteria group bacterium]|nr:hypothetical protein [Patescibacteria group bacterium]
SPINSFTVSINPGYAAKVPKNMAVLSLALSCGLVSKNDIGVFRDALAKQNGFTMVNVENIKEDASPPVGTAKNNFTISFVLDSNVIKKGAK